MAVESAQSSVLSPQKETSVLELSTEH